VSKLSVKLETPVGRALVVVARLAVAGVFVFAAVPKLVDPAAFASDIGNYRLLPEPLEGPLAVVLPVLELVVAGALAVGIEARGAALLAGVMLVTFTVAMGQAMARGIDLSCGCFGGAEETTVGWGPIARNVAMLAGCAVVLVGPEVTWWRLRGSEDSEEEPSP